MSLTNTRILAGFLVLLGIFACVLSIVSRDPFVVSIGKFSVSAGLFLLSSGIALYLWKRPLTAKEIGNVVYQFKEGVTKGVSVNDEKISAPSTNAEFASVIKSIRTENKRRTLVISTFLLALVLIAAVVVLFYVERSTELIVAKHALVPIESELSAMIDENILGDHLTDKYRTTRSNLTNLEKEFDLLKSRPTFRELVTILDSVFSTPSVDSIGLKSAASVFWSADNVDSLNKFTDSVYDPMLPKLFVLKGKIVQQLTKNVYVDSLPRALYYFNSAYQLDHRYDAALIGMVTIQLELVKGKHSRIERDYLLSLSNILQHYDSILKKTVSRFQRARLLNNKSDLLLDLMNKYLDGKVKKDFMNSEPLRALFNLVANKPIDALREIRSTLDSTVDLLPNTYPIYLTRAQFFATYARCLKSHPAMRGTSASEISARVFENYSEMSFARSLDNTVDCLRTASQLGPTRLELIDTTSDDSGRSPLINSYLSSLLASSKHLELAMNLKRRNQSWKNCPDFMPQIVKKID